MLKRVFVGGVLWATMFVGAYALTLQGMMPVNITSDTAANAKNIAFDEARRQIISDSLRQYVDGDSLRQVVANASGADLVPMIATSSIDDEHVSDTTYSANISMTLDVDAVRAWLESNAVQNWLPDDRHQDMFVVNITLENPLPDWGDLNRIARAEQINIGTKSIHGNTVVLELPVSKRAAWTIALREAGWRYSDNDGVLRIWK